MDWTPYLHYDSRPSRRLVAGGGDQAGAEIQARMPAARPRLVPSSANEAPTPASARAAIASSSNPKTDRQTSYSPVRREPNMDGSSLPTVQVSPASSIAGSGCSARLGTERVRRLEVGQTS